MRIYLYNFIFLTLLLIICELKILSKNWYKKISLFYFLIVFGQRWSAGVDFYGYLKYYITGFKTEIGYRVIQNYFFKNNIYFGILIFIIYFFTTAVSLWFFLKFIKSNYGIYIFFLSEYHIMSINPLRTYIAINFFLIGIYNLYFYKNKIKFIIFIIFGILFHRLIIFAVLFLILFYFLENYKKMEKIIFIFLFILPVIPIYEILKMVAPYFYYGRIYIGSVYDVPLSLLNIIRYYIVLIFYIFLYNKNRLKDIKFNFINKGMLIFMFLMGISTHIGPIHRIAYFFKIFEVLYFSYIFLYTNLIKKFLILSFFIVNYIFIYYKDIGVLRYYELKILHLKNEKNYYEYNLEINKNKLNKDVKFRIRK